MLNANPGAGSKAMRALAIGTCPICGSLIDVVQTSKNIKFFCGSFFKENGGVGAPYHFSGPTKYSNTLTATLECIRRSNEGSKKSRAKI